MIDFLTKTQHERSEQIDKVYEIYEAAYRAYGDGRFAKATNALCGLRDYLNSINLPGRKPKRNCDVYGKHDIVEEFEKFFGHESHTVEEQDEYMRENWFLFRGWIYDEAKKNGGAK